MRMRSVWQLVCVAACGQSWFQMPTARFSTTGSSSIAVPDHALPPIASVRPSLTAAPSLCRSHDNAERGCGGYVVEHGEPLRWRRVGSMEATEQRPAAVALIEQEAEEHWAQQRQVLAAAPQQAAVTGPERLELPEPSFESEAQALEVVEQEVLGLSAFCGAAARNVAGTHLRAGWKPAGVVVEELVARQADTQSHCSAAASMHCWTGRTAGLPCNLSSSAAHRARWLLMLSLCTLPSLLCCSPAAARLRAAAGHLPVPPLGCHRPERVLLAAAPGPGKGAAVPPRPRRAAAGAQLGVCSAGGATWSGSLPAGSRSGAGGSGAAAAAAAGAAGSTPAAGGVCAPAAGALLAAAEQGGQGGGGSDEVGDDGVERELQEELRRMPDGAEVQPGAAAVQLQLQPMLLVQAQQAQQAQQGAAAEEDAPLRHEDFAPRPPPLPCKPLPPEIVAQIEAGQGMQAAMDGWRKKSQLVWCLEQMRREEEEAAAAEAAEAAAAEESEAAAAAAAVAAEAEAAQEEEQGVTEIDEMDGGQREEEERQRRRQRIAAEQSSGAGAGAGPRPPSAGLRQWRQQEQQQRRQLQQWQQQQEQQQREQQEREQRQEMRQRKRQTEEVLEEYLHPRPRRR